VSKVVLDDHLLRDLLADEIGRDLARLLRRHEPATTNLYLYRLCKSVVAAPGGALTGGWTPEQRRELGRRLVTLPDSIEVAPLQTLAYRMAELATTFRVSTLGAEAAAAAEHLAAPLGVWEGDDGPGIRAAVTGIGETYKTLGR
jgi:hypothetical protein